MEKNNKAKIEEREPLGHDWNQVDDLPRGQ